MPNGLFVRLPAVHQHPSSEVSEVVRQKAKLFQHKVPILPLLVIPRSTLQLIAKHSKLVTKVETLIKRPLLKDLATVDAVKRATIAEFKRMTIPQEVRSAFIGEYFDYLGGSFVNVSSEGNFGNIKHQNVTGDASVFESFLSIWAESFFFLYQYAPKNIPLLQLITQNPILIEKSVQAKVSGIAYTLNPATLEKNNLTIYSTWGNFSSEQTQPLDCFLVDLRNFESLQTQIVPKPVQLKITADNFMTVNVPKRQQLVPSLDSEQLKLLSHLIIKIKQQSVDHLEIHWLYENYQFFIQSVKPLDLFDIPQEHKARTEKYQHTITKLYISTGNPDRASDHITKDVDGVGIFRSEYVLAKLGFHPSFIVSSKYKKVLEQEYALAIVAYQSRLQGKPFLFRSLNMTSSELLRLQYSNQYEAVETNPYLGFRGGMRLLANSDWFDFELKIISQALKKFRSPIGLVLPFVRTPSELSQLLTKINSANLSNFAHFQIWLQVSTPANLLDLENYPLEKFSGLTINLRSLHGLINGIDPDNSELMGRYPIKYEVMISVLTSAIKKIKKHFPNLQIFIHMEDYQASLARAAISLGITGLVVKPPVVQSVKADIIDAEQLPFGKI